MRKPHGPLSSLEVVKGDMHDEMESFNIEHTKQFKIADRSMLYHLCTVYFARFVFFNYCF